MNNLTSPGIACNSSDCSNNGICFGVKGQYYCACNLGYSGKNCEIGEKFKILFSRLIWNIMIELDATLISRLCK